eukprot:EG_transcript_35956
MLNFTKGFWVLFWVLWGFKKIRNFWGVVPQNPNLSPPPQVMPLGPGFRQKNITAEGAPFGGVYCLPCGVAPTPSFDHCWDFGLSVRKCRKGGMVDLRPCF